MEPRHTTGINILLILTAGIASFNYGYMNNVIPGSFAQRSFIKKFLSGSNAPSITDAIVSGFFGFALVGTGAILLVIAGALQAGSVHIAMFLVARYIAGAGCGILMSNTPVYMSEIAPPHTHGLLVGLQGNCITLGMVIPSCAALGFHFVEKSYQWRLNFIISTAVALCLLFSLFLLPESPRWLVEQGRKEEAGQILERLHKTIEDPNGILAHAELVQIVAQVEAEKSLPTGYVHIATGLSFLANMTPILFANLGYGTTLQLSLSLVWTVCNFLGCFVNIFLIDKVGRVKLLAAGGFGIATLLSIEAALEKYYLSGENKSGIQAAVAMYFLIAVWYTSTIECTGYVYGCVIWPTYLRSRGATISYFGFYVTSIWVNAPAALATSTIGWKYYMVFIAVVVPLTIAILVLCPETTGLTLEEIGGKFGDKVEVEFIDALEERAPEKIQCRAGSLNYSS